MRLLVLDAYSPRGREGLVGAGGTEAGELYRRLLAGLAPDASIEIARPADPERPSLEGVDATVWTGSDLSVCASDDPPVRRQLELAAALFERGVPSFGSCWGAQVFAVATGGRAVANAKGREFGVARRIELTPEGREHPLYRGKGPVFDALASHADEVCELPGGSVLLASNGWSHVQAIAIERESGCFWAVQYHPEYDLHEVASLTRLRRDELVMQGVFPDAAAADLYVEQLEALHADPSRADLARALELGSDVLDPELRAREVRNWLEACVRP